MYSSTVCIAALYVQQHCMYSSTVCTAALYVQQHCMYSSTVCTAALYVQQHCMYSSTVCFIALHWVKRFKLQWSGYHLYSGAYYNERMLQRKVFINKIMMLQRTRRNKIGRRSMRVRVTCPAFPLWLERQSSSVLSSVRFSYQFISVICLLVQCVKVKYINFVLFLRLLFLILYYIFPVQMIVLYVNCAVGCGPTWNGLPLNTYISM